MGTKMLLDAAHPEETRVVTLRGNKIEEFDYESASRKQIRGNIYLAKVTRVEPSLQAAFVDYGGNRHGFLAFSEIHPDYYQIPMADRQALVEAEANYQKADDEPDEAGSGSRGEADGDGSDGEEASEESRGRSRKGGRRKRGASARADAESVEEDGDNGSSVESVGAEDALEEVPRHQRSVKRNYKIQEVIKRRQILLVQVVKEERGNKGAALTTYLSLAGRYCVLMPNTARGGGISRKITDASDRRRLKEAAKSMSVPEGMGLIVRTAGANRTKAEIKRDYDYLLRLWENIRDLTLKSTAPCLIYEEGSLIKRAIRDLYTKDVDTVLVEGDHAYREAKEFMKMLMPSHARHVKAYKEPRPLFSRYQVEGQLDGLFLPTVTLESGGYIVINQTEALVSIDVNSGKSTREHNIEDTALKTNLEAAEEVARQLRLRDLAGLIVIDFIDMEEKRNNRSVERRLKESLKNDRARIQVGRISHFGLLEMSRQRLRVGMLEGSTLMCPHCEGHGFIRSVESCALSVLRGIEEHLLRRQENITVLCDAEVASYLLNQKRNHVLGLESAYGVSVFIQPGADQKSSQFKIEKAEARNIVPPKPAVAVQIDSAYSDEAEDDEAEAEAEIETDIEPEAEDAEARDGGDEDGDRDQDGQKKRRRRRRGRRGGRRNKTRADEHGETHDDDREQDEASAASDDGDADSGEGESRTQDAEEPAVAAAAESAEGAEADTVSEEAPAKGRRRSSRTRKPKAEKVETADTAEAEAPAPAETPEPADADAAPAGATAETSAEESPAEPAEEPAKPARRKRTTKAKSTSAASRKKKAEEAKAGEDETEKPAPKKRTRRTTKTAAKKAEEAAAEAAPAEAEAAPAEADTTVEPAPAPETPAPAMTEAASPSQEFVTTEAKSEAEAEPAAASAQTDTAVAERDEKPAPRRRGWWQRRILGND